MERGLLSSNELAPHYDEVVWFYLYQDFTHSERDLQAERIAIRFGISSWPQHFLVDPADLAILADTGRSLESFEAALADKKVGDIPKPGLDELRAIDALAAEVRGAKSWKLAEKHIGHSDPVVRLRSAARLAKDRPRALVDRASKLLKIEHDQLRYLVCKSLASTGETDLARELDALLTDPGRSMNPNVVRCEAARALASCGDALSLTALRPHAVSGDAFNSLTRIAIDSLVEIAAREPKSRREVRTILIAAFPAVPDPDHLPKGRTHEQMLQFATRLAEHVHASLESVTRKKRKFPGVYDSTTRATLLSVWRK